MKQTLSILLVTVIAMAACAKKDTSRKDDQASVNQDTTATYIIDPAMRYLSSEEVNQLYVQAEKVDMIFYNHPISVNQEDAASVKNTAMYVMPTPPSVTARCNALGRLAWLAGGAILREADVYVGIGCNYLLFIENNKPVAANALANEGVNFFTNIISQVKDKQLQPQSQPAH